jgi:opacity protein-like surface antigen
MAQIPDADVRVGFMGSPVRYNLKGIEAKRSSFQAGAGLKIETGANIDISLNYDADISSKFSEHRVSLELGYRF